MNIGPRNIGPYSVLEVLGRGGMGIVYRAQHRETSSIVALKTIGIIDEIQIEAIRREIRALARISHPGIVTIIDEGLQRGLPWYAMEFVDGLNLRKYFVQIYKYAPQYQNTFDHDIISNDVWWTTNLLIRKPGREHASLPEPALLPPHKTGSATGRIQPASSENAENELAQVMTVIRKLCAPLAFLHGEGIIHGDLKPENIMITKDGNPVLVDFGLMNRFSGEEGRETLNVQQADAGTVKYMAPEQFKGDFVDARTDLYALGCIFYELLVGLPPSLDLDHYQVILAHMDDIMPPLIKPSHFRSEIAPEIDELVCRLLAKEPRKRVGHADAVATTLAQFTSDEIVVENLKPKAYLYRSRFNGRDMQLAKLKEYGQRLEKGTGGIVLVGGESGVGKTRLVMEFGHEMARDRIQVITGECTDRAGQSLEAFQKPLQKIANRCQERGLSETEILLGKRGKVLALYEPSLKNLPGQDKYPDPVSLNPDEARLRLFSYLSKTLNELALGGPVVLIIDDLHWADELTLEYFEFVLRTYQLSRSSILFLGTYRSEEVSARFQNVLDRKGIDLIELARLDEQAVRAMVGDMLAMHPPPQHFCNYLCHHSEGIPFFVSEYLRTAVDEGLLVRDNQGNWKISMETATGFASEELFNTLTLPLSLIGLLQRRQANLSERARSIIKIAAIIGRKVNLLLLWELSQLDDIGFTDTIEELLRHQIFEQIGSGLVRFVHDKIREVSLSQLDGPEKQMLHRLVAEGIETLSVLNRETYLAELGKHWELAGEKEKARTCLLAAARITRDHLDYHEAERLYHAYLRLVIGETEESLIARAEYGDILEGIGRYDAALDEYTRIYTQTDHDLIRASCLRKKAAILGMKENVTDARQTYLEALRLSETFPLEQVQILNDLVYFIGNLQGNVQEAKQLCQRALDLVLSQGTLTLPAHDNHPETLKQSKPESEIQKIMAQTLRRFGLVYWLLGSLDRALEYYQLSLNISERIQDVRGIGSTQGQMGIIYAQQGDQNHALEYLQKYLTINQEIGNRRSIASASGNIGLVYLEYGDITQALEFLQQSLTIFQEIGDKPNIGMASSNIGLVYYDCGDLDSALECYERSLQIAEEIDYKRGIGSTSCNLGKIFITRGDPDRALEFFQKSLKISQEISDKTSEAEVLLELSEAYRLMGDLTRAFHYNSRAMELCQEMGDEKRIVDCLCFRAEAETDGKAFSAARASLARAAVLSEQQKSGEYSWCIPLTRVRLAIAELKRIPAELRSKKQDRLIAVARKLVDESLQTHRMFFKIYAFLLMGMALEAKQASEVALIFFEEALTRAQKHGYSMLERQIMTEMDTCTTPNEEW
ncbi:tetratricopeptide repeat protein [candidate division CSSED10-310 bacterium]|uniref:Tetratricopeptide repeat protein n=1 Tax=candidate division CSSED10-310 bacterium TaxID=2855610 RepID=A0ABV6YYI8_UNCC1